jgi:hypothetical protein
MVCEALPQNFLGFLAQKFFRRRSLDFFGKGKIEVVVHPKKFTPNNNFSEKRIIFSILG